MNTWYVSYNLVLTSMERGMSKTEDTRAESVMAETQYKPASKKLKGRSMYLTSQRWVPQASRPAVDRLDQASHRGVGHT